MEINEGSGLISIIESINTDISNRHEHHQRAGTSTTLDMQQPRAEEGETPIEVAADQHGDSVSIWMMCTIFSDLLLR